MSGFFETLVDAFGDRVRRDVPLREYTTFRVGGPAQYFLEARGSDDILRALALAHSAHVPVTMLGGGSNVLVADAGVRGLIIRPRGGDVRRVGESRIRADAAVTMNGLVRWTIVHEVAGLESWAGTPGTVGGAIFGNAHFGGRSIGELVEEVRVASLEGTSYVLPVSQMEFAYDRSRLQRTGEVLLSADFRTSSDRAATLRERARQSLAYRKRTQPLDRPSAGCIFQNPVPGRDTLPMGIPWSAGALVDRAGLKDLAVGGARVSTAHGNFIINDGSATAADIRELVERCRRAVREKFGVELREEIQYLGEGLRSTHARGEGSARETPQ